MNTANTPPCALHATQRVYDAEYAHCPRSPEWKAGALRGLRKRAGLSQPSCPYPCGTAQSDAWLAGNLEGIAEWQYLAERGQV